MQLLIKKSNSYNESLDTVRILKNFLEEECEFGLNELSRIELTKWCEFGLALWYNDKLYQDSTKIFIKEIRLNWSFRFCRILFGQDPLQAMECKEKEEVANVN